MKTRYRILIANILLQVVGQFVANLIGQNYADNYNGVNILDKILHSLGYSLLMHLFVYVTVTIFSIIGYIVAMRIKKQEWKVGFGISLIFNVTVLILFFILSHL